MGRLKSVMLISETPDKGGAAINQLPHITVIKYLKTGEISIGICGMLYIHMINIKRKVS